MWQSLSKLGLSLLSGRKRQHLVIFTYHRVLEEKDYLLPSEPDRNEFGKHAEWIAKYMRPLPLDRALDQLFSGELPPRAACVTFDDGYRNNYEVAAPILESNELPATFFITTGAIQQGSMWNDQIIEAVRVAPNDWDLTEFGLDRYACGDRQERYQTLTELLKALKYLSYDERQQTCLDIYGSVSDRPLDLMMTPEMITSLRQRAFSIGAHTETHPILLQLQDAQAQKEITGCRRWLSDLLGTPPHLFAYPNGRFGLDFGPEHVDMVAAAGFRFALSTDWGIASKNSHPFALPRMTPWELEEKGWVIRIAKTYLADRIKNLRARSNGI